MARWRRALGAVRRGTEPVHHRDIRSAAGGWRLAALVGAVLLVLAVTVVSMEWSDTDPRADVSSPASDVAPRRDTPSGAPSDFPGPSDTGVPPGTRLTPSGSLVVTTDGTTIDGLDVEGQIRVEAEHVTIRRSRITTESNLGIQVDEGSVVVEDTEVVGVGDRCQAGIGWANYTARRVDVHGCRDGLKVGDDTVVVDSYIHDQARGSGFHNDAIQASGAARGIRIEGNTILGPLRASVSAIKISTQQGPIADVSIRGNYLSGGGMLVYVTDKDQGFGPPRDVEIVGNVMERGSFRNQWLSSDGDDLRIDGNVWHDDRSPVA